MMETKANAFVISSFSISERFSSMSSFSRYHMILETTRSQASPRSPARAPPRRSAVEASLLLTRRATVPSEEQLNNTPRVQAQSPPARGLGPRRRVRTRPSASSMEGGRGNKPEVAALANAESLTPLGYLDLPKSVGKVTRACWIHVPSWSAVSAGLVVLFSFARLAADETGRNLLRSFPRLLSLPVLPPLPYP